MERAYEATADAMRGRIGRGGYDGAEFRAALMAVPARDQDAWVDRVLGTEDSFADSSELPSGCVPYLPSDVDALVDVVDLAHIGADDVVVDIGAGIGRAMACVHLLTGASAIGIEVQTKLAQRAAEVARLVSSRISIVHGDADAIDVPAGTVYLLYCPFSGQRLARLFAKLEAVARPIRVACIDLPLPACDWLEVAGSSGGVTVYRSTSVATRR